MLARLRRADLTLPTFDSRLSRFTVTFPKHTLLTAETLRWIEGLGQPGSSRGQISALALMREDRQVSNGTLRQLGPDSREATNGLADLVARGLAYRSGGRRYAEYLLDAAATPTESLRQQPELDLDAATTDPSSSDPASPARRRYDRTTEIEALFTGGDTLTSAQVATTTGLGQAMTNRYLTRRGEEGRLEATAPPRSPSRAYRRTRA